MAQFIDIHRQAILDRLREAYVPVALEQGDLTAYGEARNLDGIEADPAWLDLYAYPPEELIADQVSKWLAAHGAETDLARQTQLTEISELRSSNFSALDDVVRDAELRVRAWARKHATPIPAGWNAPAASARSALEQSYLADFLELVPDQILSVIAGALGWPDQMPRALNLEELELAAADLITREEEADEERRRRQHERTHLHVDGREISVGIENLAGLADQIAAGLGEDLLAQSGKTKLAPMPGSSRRRSDSGVKSGLTVARLPRMSEEQRTAVGLIGEVIARSWLERHYAGVEWVSGYRNIVVGDTVGSDSHGYDFIVQRPGGRRLYFEVKTLAGEVADVTEIELGETEVVAAQQHRDSFRILLVCSALDSTSREIFELPSPLAARGAGHYTLLGRGLRYRCALARS